MLIKFQTALYCVCFMVVGFTAAKVHTKYQEDQKYIQETKALLALHDLTTQKEKQAELSLHESLVQKSMKKQVKKDTPQDFEMVQSQPSEDISFEDALSDLEKLEASLKSQVQEDDQASN